MNRDILEIDDLLVCTDVSASIGELPLDQLSVPYEVVGYFLARVVLMEMVSVGGQPLAYTLSNVSNNGYDSLHKGISRLLAELSYSLPNITSSETNFNSKQSSASITLIGRKTKDFTTVKGELAVAGIPLVGEEVMNGEILSLQLFQQLCKDDRVLSVIPVGSKGILEEVRMNFGIEVTSAELDLYKSSGPSTCCIVSYKDDTLLKDYKLFKLKEV